MSQLCVLRGVVDQEITAHCACRPFGRVVSAHRAHGGHVARFLVVEGKPEDVAVVGPERSRVLRVECHAKELRRRQLVHNA